MEVISLIKNEDYEKVISDNSDNFEDFLFPKVEDLEIKNSNEFIKDICILLKDQDRDKFASYALETRIDAGSRPKRIPMLRKSEKSISIWKSVNKLEKVDRAIAELNDIISFIKNGDKIIKVLIVTESEEKYSKNNKRNNLYVERIISENKLVWFSYNFFKDLIQGKNKIINIEKYLTKNGHIYLSNK